MDILKREALMRELEKPNITDKERANLYYKLYKLDRKPDWMMSIFVGLCVLDLFIATIMLTQ